MSIKFKRVAAVAATSLVAAGALVGIASTPAHAAQSIVVSYSKCSAAIPGFGTQQSGGIKFTFTYPSALTKTYKPGAKVSLKLAASVKSDPSAFIGLGVTQTAAKGTATLTFKGGKLSGTLSSKKAAISATSSTSGTVSGTIPKTEKTGSYALAVPTTAKIAETVYGGPLDGKTVTVTCTGGKASAHWAIKVKK